VTETEQKAIVQRMGKEITDHIEYYLAQNAQEDNTQ